jgi:hypothetical protein
MTRVVPRLPEPGRELEEPALELQPRAARPLQVRAVPARAVRDLRLPEARARARAQVARAQARAASRAVAQARAA